MEDDVVTPPAADPPGEEASTDDDPSLLEKLRDTGVGVVDPNIIGDATGTDIPPGTDPPTGPPRD